jgi:zinc and cadmium transporter
VRALWFNAASSLTSIIGGLAGYFALRRTLDVLPYAISVAAASLIYVAVADLIPGLHRRVELSAGAAQVGLIACGVGVIACAELWLA